MNIPNLKKWIEDHSKITHKTSSGRQAVTRLYTD